ncbi:MAG: type IX secretion system protein PorQ [Bacteroidetes bacterium]|nr:type IX secretion system protein PorQ [Bacteroidota bacterium]
MIALSGAVNVRSQSLSSFDFLRLAPSAQAAALGGTLLTSTSSQASAMFYNPALLDKKADGALSISWLNHLSDLQAGTVTYSRDLGVLGMAAVGTRFIYWGRIPRSDQYGESSSSFSSGNIALTAGLSRSWLPQLRYGANLHIAYTSIAEFNALAVAIDAGIVYYIPEQEFTLSAGASNIGVTLSSLGQTRDEVPLDLRIAVSKQLRYIPVLVGLTLNNLQNVHQITSVDKGFRHAIFSLEFRAIPVFHLRLGYNHRKRNLKSDQRLDLAGTAVGFGLRIRRFHLDYSFSSWSFAGLHQFTVMTHFNRRDQ